MRKETPIVLTNKIEPKTPNQSKYLESIYRNTYTICTGPAGTGKCHKKGTLIRMYDGSVKPVEQIENGEYVMGDDSTPRLVYGVTTGKEEMYEIIPIKGDPFTVNKSHILCLKNTTKRDINKSNPEYIEISVEDYLKKSKTWKKYYKLYRVPVSYDRYPVKVDPYFMGLWLGDGNWNQPTITNIDKEVINFIYNFADTLNMTVSNTQSNGAGYTIKEKNRIYTNKGSINFLKKDFKSYGLMLNKNKFIPRDYIINDKQTRLELLAGIIDSDGHLTCNCFEITSKHKKLAENIREIALSLGFWCSFSPVLKSCVYKGKKRIGQYYRLFISGEIDQIPTKIKRKQATLRKQIKDVRNTGFDIKSIGVGEYYGFAVDGNHKYLLEDFIVTHNTVISIWAALQYLLDPASKIDKIIFIRPFVKNKFEIDIGSLPGDILEKMMPLAAPIIDNMLLFLERKHINKLIHEETIEFVPLSFIRGRSFNNCFCIVDEAQNILSGGVYTVMSRLGQNSKMVISGDLAQSDLKVGDSALIDAINRLATPNIMKGVDIIEMNKTDIQRNNLLRELMKRFEIV